MDFSNDILRYDEQVIMHLRSLYKQFGYTQYRMSRFEEYGLYAENKSFLASGDILTFTGEGGKLMALRPDVTLSIVKNTKDDGKQKKLYYNENVYRSDGHEFSEQMQVGLEYIGDIGIDAMCEVLMLAKRSLEAIGEQSRLDISHMGYLEGLLQSNEMTPAQKAEIIHCISEKNLPGLKALCANYGFDSGFCDRLTALTAIYGPYDEVNDELRRISINEETDAALQELEQLNNGLNKLGVDRGINIDFSIINDIGYYSGIIFQGYMEGIPAKVLSGGRYDKLLRKFGKRTGAIGFAVYLDLLERLNPACTGAESTIINIALPKGRLGEKAYAIFEAAGYGCPEINEDSRKLVFENAEKGVRFFWVKPSDVAIYVDRGAADIGVAGKDILLEYSKDVYELLDLDIGKCRMCVAAVKGFTPDAFERTLRVATKFPNTARKHFARKGREIDVIELNGSIELAPILGLSDVVVDIVETGKTLQENNMEPVEEIADISARLISNKASYKFNNAAINKLCGKISEQMTKNALVCHI
jgi:ATP phosphoribosyltransferase regulatory subunit